MSLTIAESQALYKLYPNVIRISGDEAFDAEGNKVEYDKNSIKSYVDSRAYIAKRSAEYPSVADYLDGLVKGDQAQIDKYIADCLAVKAKYPKGTV